VTEPDVAVVAKKAAKAFAATLPPLSRAARMVVINVPVTSTTRFPCLTDAADLVAVEPRNAEADALQPDFCPAAQDSFGVSGIGGNNSVGFLAAFGTAMFRYAIRADWDLVAYSLCRERLRAVAASEFAFRRGAVSEAICAFMGFPRACTPVVLLGIEAFAPGLLVTSVAVRQAAVLRRTDSRTTALWANGRRIHE
jgi:hypothetical protein